MRATSHDKSKPSSGTGERRCGGLGTGGTVERTFSLAQETLAEATDAECWLQRGLPASIGLAYSLCRGQEKSTMCPNRRFWLALRQP